MRFLFRGSDELGAVNLIKRVWHKAYLDQRLSHYHPGVQNLRRVCESFDSVPAVAAAPYAECVRKLTATSGPLREWFVSTDGFPILASAARGWFIGGTIAEWDSKTESDWFRLTDASAFYSEEWDSAIAACQSEQGKLALGNARAALAALQTQVGSKPARYYAVLALDGDEMGKWIAGEKSPAINNVMAPEAAKYFREHVKTVNVEAWLDSPRPVSPSFHLQFSEALANFALYAARRIVEHHHGQLIYAGGDDVLAMLPADEAFACAQGLRLAFQGHSRRRAGVPPASSEASSPQTLPELYPALFADCPDGFVKLADKNKHNNGNWDQGARRPVEPSWPLLVPGSRATVSVGLAIGHIREPLQDMVQEAQAAEKRAKAKPATKVFDREKNQEAEKLNEGWGRDALAVTLFKRSGETLRWGARFDSPAFDLLAYFQPRYRSRLDDPKFVPPISGKFPYRLAELLGHYEARKELTPELKDITAREFAHVVKQQADALPDGDKPVFQTLAETYLQHILGFQWKDDGGQTRCHARPLAEFYHLFAVEAFIARRGE